MENLQLDRRRFVAMVKDAGAIAMRYFNKTAGQRKSDSTVVTDADREVEEFLRTQSKLILPEASFIGEETGRTEQGRGLIWLAVDPIDGTSAFVAGIPTWCVSVGVMAGAKPVAGAVYLPAVDELYVCHDGSAWWNEKQLGATSQSNTGGDRFVVAYSGFHRRHRVRFSGKVRSLGSTAYHICLVARGAATGALLGHAHIWDLAASVAVLQAVGGEIVELSGKPLVWDDIARGQRAGDYLVAARRENLREVLPVFQERCS